MGEPVVHVYDERLAGVATTIFKECGMSVGKGTEPKGFLTGANDQLKAKNQCQLVFTADITQDREAILNAYDGNAGGLRAFYQYGITRMNKEEGSEIDLDKFTYQLDFVRNTSPEYMSYARSYIEAKEDIRYSIPGLGIDLVMEKGERLYFHEGAGVSCKYTLEQIQTIVQKAGLRLVKTCVDEGKHVAFCQCVTI